MLSLKVRNRPHPFYAHSLAGDIVRRTAVVQNDGQFHAPDSLMCIHFWNHTVPQEWFAYMVNSVPPEGYPCQIHSQRVFLTQNAILDWYVGVRSAKRSTFTGILKSTGGVWLGMPVYMQLCLVGTELDYQLGQYYQSSRQFYTYRNIGAVSVAVCRISVFTAALWENTSWWNYYFPHFIQTPRSRSHSWLSPPCRDSSVISWVFRNVTIISHENCCKTWIELRSWKIRSVIMSSTDLLRDMILMLLKLASSLFWYHTNVWKFAEQMPQDIVHTIYSPLAFLPSWLSVVGRRVCTCRNYAVVRCDSSLGVFALQQSSLVDGKLPRAGCGQAFNPWTIVHGIQAMTAGNVGTEDAERTLTIPNTTW